VGWRIIWLPFVVWLYWDAMGFIGKAIIGTLVGLITLLVMWQAGCLALRYW
jgi:hypothetical protein